MRFRAGRAPSLLQVTAEPRRAGTQYCRATPAPCPRARLAVGAPDGTDEISHRLRGRIRLAEGLGSSRAWSTPTPTDYPQEPEPGERAASMATTR